MPLQEVVSQVALALAKLAVGLFVLIVLYRLALILIDRAVPRLTTARTTALGVGPQAPEEKQKRIATIQGLLRRLVRVAAVFAFAVLLLDAAGQLELVAALGVVVLTVLLACQAIVLDYVMGLMILLEGPFHRGDWLRVAMIPPVEGEVVEVDLRRTVLRDADGAVHNVSNGLIRTASNFSRGYSVAATEVTIVRASDLEKALVIAREVVADERVFGDEHGVGALLDDPRPEAWITRLTPDGCTMRASRRVKPGTGVRASSELRRSLVAGFEAASIAVSRADAASTVQLAQTSAGAGDQERQSNQRQD